MTDIDNGTDEAPVRDPLRPEAKNGRYPLPHPETGQMMTWQRVTNFVKLTDDTYHLDRWKQRNVAKGVAMLATEKPALLAALAACDVKEDKERVNTVVDRAFEKAETYRMADEGTRLHASTELVDFSKRTDVAPEHHQRKMALYVQALESCGITVAHNMIERVTVSTRYAVAGKLDRIYMLADGSYVVGDVKTGDSLDLSMPSIAAQMDCYRDGINNAGVFDGTGYDRNIKVRNDFAVIVHLPSTRDECVIELVDLQQGQKINEANLVVQQARRIKARHIRLPFAMLPREGHEGMGS